MFRDRTLIGTAEQVIERIAHYRDIGFTEMSFLIRTGTLSHAPAMAAMERFNRDVLPALRDRVVA